MSLNNVQIIGNLGNNADVKHFPETGGAVANLSVAVTESWKDKDGNKQEATEWVNVVLNGAPLVNALSQYLVKGQQVFVQGKLKTRRYQDKNTGADRYATEVHVGVRGEIQLLGSPKGSNQNQAAAPQQGGFGAQPGQPAMQAAPQQGGFGAQPGQPAMQAAPQQGGFGAQPGQPQMQAAPQGGFGAQPNMQPNGFAPQG